MTKRAEIEQHIDQIICRLGDTTDRAGMRETPARYAKAMEFFTQGYEQTPKEVVGNALYDAENQDEIVLVRDIEIYSLCEHHLVPFFGRAHVAYIPDQKIIGLSKVARLVDIYARRFQVQERLTAQIADAMMEILEPKGAGVMIEANHLCMMMRGVQKQNSKTVTSSVQGVFRDDSRSRMELMHLFHAHDR